MGAHAGNNNYDSIGVCFEGNYMTETAMPDAQRAAGAELVAYLKQKYGITKVQKHRDVNATGCPGDNFPFERPPCPPDGPGRRSRPCGQRSGTRCPPNRWQDANCGSAAPCRS